MRIPARQIQIIAPRLAAEIAILQASPEPTQEDIEKVRVSLRVIKQYIQEIEKRLNGK